MKPTKPLVLLAFLFPILAVSEEPKVLPEKLKKLQGDYLAAIEKATAPITDRYLQELAKLKAEYLRTSDLPGAVATEEVIKAMSAVAKPTGLHGMSDAEFKRWLRSVKISEVDSPYGHIFVYDNDIVTSMRSDKSGVRNHTTGTVDIGRLVAPFANTTATIIILPTLTEARISYTGGGTFKAEISDK